MENNINSRKVGTQWKNSFNWMNQFKLWNHKPFQICKRRASNNLANPTNKARSTKVNPNLTMTFVLNRTKNFSKRILHCFCGITKDNRHKNTWNQARNCYNQTKTFPQAIFLTRIWHWNKLTSQNSRKLTFRLFLGR